MKKKFKMENLDCAHCAAKMEDGIKKIAGVRDATVNFMTQKLVIEADDELFDDIVKQASSVCAGIDSECRIIVE